MSLLSWQTALWVAAIAVPLLLLLYFLKLRRQERKVSSTLLWKKAVHDLQVNAPFQKLRKNLLLFLQLLILAAVLFGLADPVANFMKRPDRNIVLLMDRSGSMKTVEADGRTRLEHAKEAAVDFVSGLADGSRVMVIGFADRANVVCSFTDDKRRLNRLIREIEPTDAASKIGEALQLAVAYSTNFIELEGSGLPGAALQGRADIELFSDGRILDADEEYVTRGDLHYWRIGAAEDNVGIVAFDVSRNYERPGVLLVFARIENFGPQPVTLDVSLLLDGKRLSQPGAVQAVSLGPAAAQNAGAANAAPPARRGGPPPSRQVIFELYHEAGGVVEVTLHRDDALAIDNVVAAPIDPPREARVLIVSDRPQVRALLERGLSSIGVAAIASMGSTDYDNADDDDENFVTDGRSAYDLVVLDRHDTDHLPPGNYLFFGGVPRIEGVDRATDDDGQPVVFENEPLVVWKEDHPLIRKVAFENVYVGRWIGLALPGHALPLVEGEDSTVLAFITDPGHRYIISAFDLLDSDFLFEPAYVIFLQNAVMYLTRSGLSDASHLVTPGETLTLQVPPGAEEVRITPPDGPAEDLDVRGRHTLTFPRTHRAGVYRAEFDDDAKTVEVFAANILDPNESRIVSNESFSIGAEEVVTIAGRQKVNRPLWPYAAAAALLFLVVEWWIYNRRVML